ncbi:MAG: response regulator transcription factor [Cocleimonas sp.]|nr:response regulator transcription factor [Cocleimonas sp.]
MKLLLADDHALFNLGMEMIVKSTLQDAHLVFAEDWKAVHVAMQQHTFDLAFVDLFMPRKNHWEAELRQCIQCAPHLPICVITASNVLSHAEVAIDMGAKGFVCKTAGVTEIKKALRHLLNGQSYVPAAYDKTIKGGLTCITARQKEVLYLLSQGDNNKTISLRLGITESTVKRHVYDVFQLLGVNNRVKAGIMAKEQGLFPH